MKLKTLLVLSEVLIRKMFVLILQVSEAVDRRTKVCCVCY